MINRKRRGFFLLDTIVGLIIVAALAAVFAKAISWQRHSEQRLADVRAATRCAELALLQLQQGGPPTAPATGETVHIERESETSEIGELVWVRVTGSCGRSSVTLVGLAKRELVEMH